MELELNRLSAVETPIEGEIRVGDPDGSLARDGIRFPEPFHVQGSARMVRGVAVVTGHVTGALQLECGRCLGIVRQPIDLQFEARHAEAAPAPRSSSATHAAHRTGDARDGSSKSSGAGKATGAHGKWVDDGEGGLQLEREDLDVSFLPPGTTVLRVEDIVREQALLEVPIRPLCRPDCRGLCPRCGADLNAGDCGCPPEETHDLRLAGLAALKKRLEDDSGDEPKN
jgi:uncharacterized metal-binding protein YceD (DUF177 family)